MASDSALNLHQGRLGQSKFNGRSGRQMARPPFSPGSPSAGGGRGFLCLPPRESTTRCSPETRIVSPTSQPPLSAASLPSVKTTLINNLRVFLNSCFFLTQYLKLLSCETKTFQELQMLSSATLNCHGPVIY